MRWRAPKPPISVVVSVNDVVTCCLCPRMLYVKKVLGLVPPPTSSMARGSGVHKLYYEVSKRFVEGLLRGLSPSEVASSLMEELEGKLRSGFMSSRDYDLAEAIVEFRARNPPRPPLSFEVPVSSLDLGVVGVVDMVEGGVPVEVKFKVRPHLQDYVQLAWYSIMLEEQTGGVVEHGFLDLVPTRRVKVYMSPRLRELAVELRDRAIEVLYSSTPPRRVERRLCSRCELNLECRLLS